MQHAHIPQHENIEIKNMTSYIKVNTTEYINSEQHIFMKNHTQIKGKKTAEIPKNILTKVFPLLLSDLIVTAPKPHKNSTNSATMTNRFEATNMKPMYSIHFCIAPI